jgi:hypothetical protein
MLLAFDWARRLIKRPCQFEAMRANPAIFAVAVDGCGPPGLSTTPGFEASVNWLTPLFLSPFAWRSGQFALPVSGETRPDHAVPAATNRIDWSPGRAADSSPLPFGWVNARAGASPFRFCRVPVGPSRP